MDFVQIVGEAFEKVFSFFSPKIEIDPDFGPVEVWNFVEPGNYDIQGKRLNEVDDRVDEVVFEAIGFGCGTRKEITVYLRDEKAFLNRDSDRTLDREVDNSLRRLKACGSIRLGTDRLWVRN